MSAPQLDGFDAGQIDVQGATLHYVAGGEGDPIVLLHGFPQSWWAWRRVMPLLAQDHRMVAFDLPGIGQSRAADGFDRRTAAARLREATGRLGIERYAVAGHDIGAMIGYAWARDHREEVSHLVAIEGLLPGFGLEALMDCSRPGQQLWHFAFHADPAFAHILISGREREYFPYFFDRESADPASLPQSDRDIYVAAYQAPGGLKAGLGYYQSIFADALDNQTHARPKLSIPVLAVGGELSVGSAIANSYRQVADQVELIMMPGCGHFIPEESPESLSTELLSFLEED